jgi:ribonuclease III
LRYIIEPELEEMARKGSGLPLTDFKSALQEQLQAVGRRQPVYTLVSERGPEHSKTFTVEAQLQAAPDHGKIEFTGRAEGSTKKNAEQEVARQLLEYLESVTASESPKSAASGHAEP